MPEATGDGLRPNPGDGSSSRCLRGGQIGGAQASRSPASAAAAPRRTATQSSSCAPRVHPDLAPSPHHPRSPPPWASAHSVPATLPCDEYVVAWYAAPSQPTALGQWDSHGSWPGLGASRQQIEPARTPCRERGSTWVPWSRHCQCDRRVTSSRSLAVGEVHCAFAGSRTNDPPSAARSHGNRGAIVAVSSSNQLVHAIGAFQGEPRRRRPPRHCALARCGGGQSGGAIAKRPMPSLWNRRSPASSSQRRHCAAVAKRSPV